jgi:signal transduction histidine kinase/HAMP domain-containing protein
MDREQKTNGSKDDRSAMMLIKERINRLFPPRENIPASLSIQQAEELKARIHALESELGRKQAAGDGRTSSDEGAVLSAGVVSTFGDEIKPISTSGASNQKKTRTSPANLGTAVVNFVQQFGQSRIQTRLTALVLMITIPLLIGVTTIISSRAGAKIEADATANLQNTNEALATNVDTWLELNILNLREMTLLPDIVSMDANQQRPVLQAKSQTHTYMYLVSTTDLTGLNVARNDDGANTDYSDRDWFQKAKAGEPLTFQSLIGRTTGQPALVVSMPIQNAAGRIVGVGMFAADLTDLSNETLVHTIGKTGYSYIVDANNMVLAHPDASMTANELRNLSEYPPVAAIQQGRTGQISFTDEEGRRWRAFVSVTDNGWGVITQQEEAEILSDLNQFQGISLAFIVVAAAVMLVLTSFTIRGTLQPIHSLTRTVSAIAAGDLNQVVEVKSRDEIGVLASAFNNMTSQLREMISNLEQRVASRTHDLELASEVGRTITENIADPHQMLTKAVETIRARFNLYYTQIYLVDPSGRTITLRAGTGDVGRQLLSREHRLVIGHDSLNGRAVADKLAVIVSDTSQRDDFLPNPLLPNTRSEMVVPLIVGGQVIGTLDMQSEMPGTLSKANLPAFEALAGQFSIAIQNANLFAETEQVRRQMEANARRSTELGWQDFLDGIDRGERIGYIYDQNETVALDGSQAPLADEALSVPITITGATVGAIQTTLEQRELTPSEQEILKAAAVQLGQHIEGLRLLNQAEQYQRQAEQVTRRLTREGWGSYLEPRRQMVDGYIYDLNEVHPLTTDNGPGKATINKSILIRDEEIGELAFNLDENKPDKEAQELIDAVTKQLGEHIENLRLSEQNEKRASQLETVATVSTTASTVLDPDELLKQVVNLTKERFNLYHAHIYLLDESWDTLLLAAGAGEIGQQMATAGHAIPLSADRSLVARAAREKQAVIVNDVHGEADFLSNPLLPETRAEMAIPMIVGDTVLGVLDVQSQHIEYFSQEDISIQTTLAAQIAIALQNARLYVEQAATVTQLRELDKLKSSFLANMSHELRTPLNSILGFADVMLEELDGPLTPNMDNDLKLIQKNGQHLLHLINDVLDMAKIESGKLNLIIEKFNLHEIMEEVASITSPLASEKDLALLIDPDSDHEVEINADRTRLRQVIINLVNNAMKFTEKGKITIHIAREESNVLISVKDTGIGIHPSELETVFQEFSQVDSSTTRKTGGTGLGLPISRRLIEMHGGRLWAESTGIEGEGAAFYVFLPIEAKVTESEPITKS